MSSAPALILALFGTAVLSVDAGRVPDAQSARHSLLAVNQSLLGDRYGKKGCPCVGFDGLGGETTATLGDGTKASYPADLGGRCETWDKDHHKDCPGKDFCNQAWCYVDPCNCEDVDVLPKPSVYLPGARYHGRPVHFSYVTCGGKDEYTGKEGDNKQTVANDIKQTCAKGPAASEWGDESCRCVGIGPQPGTTKVTIGGKQVNFPADTGASCKAWEEDNHPECKGSGAPAWCSQKWCYVDPCSCKLPTPPKTTSYLPSATYRGKNIYFSYATCGGEDSYTSGNKEACVNMKKGDECAKLSKCAWTGKECLGKELVQECHSLATGRNAFFALILALTAAVH